jgi:hypothetical protein
MASISSHPPTFVPRFAKSKFRSLVEIQAQSSTFSLGSAAKPGAPGDDLTPGKANDAWIKLILHGGKLSPFFNAF